MSLRSISVKVNNQNPTKINSVTFDNNINVKVSDQSDYKVKTVSFAPNMLSTLSDVSSVNPSDGDVIIYNSETKKYEVGRIQSSEIDITNIDAGNF